MAFMSELARSDDAFRQRYLSCLFEACKLIDFLLVLGPEQFIMSLFSFIVSKINKEKLNSSSEKTTVDVCA